MKIEWEAKDIYAGLVVGRPHRAEKWIVGYDPNAASRYALISLSDGAVVLWHVTKPQIADHLTQSQEFPAMLLPVLERENS